MLYSWGGQLLGDVILDRTHGSFHGADGSRMMGSGTNSSKLVVVQHIRNGGQHTILFVRSPKALAYLFIPSSKEKKEAWWSKFTPCSHSGATSWSRMTLDKINGWETTVVWRMFRLRKKED